MDTTTKNYSIAPLKKKYFWNSKISDLKIIRSFSKGTSSGSMLFFSQIVDEMSPPSTLKLPFVGGGGKALHVAVRSFRAKTLLAFFGQNAFS